MFPSPLDVASVRRRHGRDGDDRGGIRLGRRALRQRPAVVIRGPTGVRDRGIGSRFAAASDTRGETHRGHSGRHPVNDTSAASAHLGRRRLAAWKIRRRRGPLRDVVGGEKGCVERPGVRRWTCCLPGGHHPRTPGDSSGGSLARCGLEAHNLLVGNTPSSTGPWGCSLVAGACSPSRRVAGTLRRGPRHACGARSGPQADGDAIAFLGARCGVDISTGSREAVPQMGRAVPRARHRGQRGLADRRLRTTTGRLDYRAAPREEADRLLPMWAEAASVSAASYTFHGSFSVIPGSPGGESLQPRRPPIARLDSGSGGGQPEDPTSPALWVDLADYEYSHGSWRMTTPLPALRAG